MPTRRTPRRIRGAWNSNLSQEMCRRKNSQPSVISKAGRAVRTSTGTFFRTAAYRIYEYQVRGPDQVLGFKRGNEYAIRKRRLRDRPRALGALEGARRDIAGAARAFGKPLPSRTAISFS